MTPQHIIFFIIGGLAVFAAAMVVLRKNPVISALFLIVNMMSLAVLYLSLQAQFIAIIQVLVYAGAVMVLFLFVLMLLNLGEESTWTEKITVKKMLAFGLAAVFLGQLLYVFTSSPMPLSSLPASAREIGTVESIGKTLFTDYIFPFEATSFLLLTAIVGAIVLAKKKF
ncbi:MAG: NADH-quinone oxidoreductase subunit J [Bacteroidota bacterium]